LQPPFPRLEIGYRSPAVNETREDERMFVYEVFEPYAGFFVRSQGHGFSYARVSRPSATSGLNRVAEN
jgi:hypothetical protein